MCCWTCCLSTAQACPCQISHIRFSTQLQMSQQDCLHWKAMVAGPVGRPGTAFVLLLLKAIEVLHYKVQARLEILRDSVCIDRTPSLANSGIATGTWMDEEGLFVLQSHINLTAEEAYPKSACAPDDKCLFSFVFFSFSSFWCQSQAKSGCLDNKFFEAPRRVQCL